ncbi:hypothetical protein DXG01_010723 [Tephrocybe rancida]|nr:hypothetical protein DXG01_010723 [Tephrocybe rancida]
MSMINSEYQPVRQFKAGKGPINALTFSKDMRHLLSGGPLVQFVHSNKIYASLGDDGCVRVWDTKNFSQQQTLYSPKWGQVTTLTWLHWFVWKDSNTEDIFRLNDSVEAQVFDPLNRRLAVASHSGEIKLFDVEDVVLTVVWSSTVEGGAIPQSLVFFGGANQSLLCLALETGEIGNAALSKSGGQLLIDNLSTGAFDVYKFPSSTPASSFDMVSPRRFVKQCQFSEEDHIAVCGSDHGKVYVVNPNDGATTQVLDSAATHDLIQAITVASEEDGHHYIAAGTSSMTPSIFVWEKKPPAKQQTVDEV